MTTALIALVVALPRLDGSAVYSRVVKKLRASKSAKGSIELILPQTRVEYKFSFLRPNYCKFEGKLQAHFSDGKNMWLVDYFEDPMLYGRYPTDPVGFPKGLVPGWLFGLESFTDPAPKPYKFGRAEKSKWEGKDALSFRMYIELDPDHDVTLYVDPVTNLPLGWQGNTSVNQRKVNYKSLTLGPALKAKDFAYKPTIHAVDRWDKNPKPTLHDKMLPEKSPAPILEGPAISGETFSLAAVAPTSKAVLLHFWSFSCVSCRQELKPLEALHRQYKDKGLVVVSITDDITQDDLRKYVQEGGFTMKFVTFGLGMGKPKHKLWSDYKIIDKMSSYLVNSKGEIEQRIPNLERGLEKLKFNVMMMCR